MDAAAVIIKVLAGIRNSGDDEKINAPEIINADTMKPFSEIIIFALVAASASNSISERTALRNMVSTPLFVPKRSEGGTSAAWFFFFALSFLSFFFFLGFSDDVPMPSMMMFFGVSSSGLWSVRFSAVSAFTTSSVFAKSSVVTASSAFTVSSVFKVSLAFKASSPLSNASSASSQTSETGCGASGSGRSKGFSQSETVFCGSCPFLFLSWKSMFILRLSESI